MQKYLLLSLVLFLTIGGCSQSTSVKEDIKKLSPNILMDKAAERYSVYDYKNALMYYQAVLDNYPESYEDVAWARYEMGYIYYIQKKYNKSKEYFEAAAASKNAPHAVIILSEMMLSKLPTQSISK
ncbi:tetratricopeptide repeat protein [Thermospira aquatica]|uniref:Tetratricopeptide repeat protein n=1 Tax=Thermospira aquatica TaxID=2828656 RepID=A0AAX3BBD3_9SPIR|nr:hypothetical protein [Thermospira aquatica]URA09393.1 hypothetical protein KDW03_07810 [Thermospira aquatica]